MVNDLLMWVGEEHYEWPHDFYNEARRIGVSKRIPATAIPYISPGETRLALVHPKAIVSVTADSLTLRDLAVELAGEFVIPPEPLQDDWAVSYAEDYLLADDGHTLDLHRLLAAAEQRDQLRRIEEKYGIAYRPGVFMYTYLTGIQYVLKPGEEDLPPGLDGLGIEAVRVEYD